MDINFDGSKAIVYNGSAFSIYSDTSATGGAPEVINEVSGYTQLNINPDFNKFIIAKRSTLTIKYYTYNGDVW